MTSARGPGFQISLLEDLNLPLKSSVRLQIEGAVGKARGVLLEPWASSWTEAAIRSELDLGYTLAVLAKDDLALMGFVCFRPPGPFREITLIMTLDQYRGCRLAERMVDSLFEYAFRKGIDSGAPRRGDSRSLSDAKFSVEVGLEVRADNFSALKSYAKCGFIEQGRRRGYYRDGMDAVLMSVRRQPNS